jgi:hypothetical protein
MTHKGVVRWVRSMVLPTHDRLIVTERYAALWRRCSGSRRRQWGAVARIDLESSQGLDFLGPLLCEVSGALHLDFPDSWSRTWVTAPPDGAQSLADLRAAALLRFERTYGEPLVPQTWCWQAEWHSGRAFLCSALPVAVRDALRQACANAGVRLASARPHLLRAMDAAPTRSDAVAVVAGPHVAWAQRRNGHVKAVRCAQVEHALGDEMLGQRISAHALQLGIAAPQQVSWMSMTEQALPDALCTQMLPMAESSEALA